jgi:DNA-binding NtrC family response regulator
VTFSRSRCGLCCSDRQLEVVGYVRRHQAPSSSVDDVDRCPNLVGLTRTWPSPSRLAMPPTLPRVLIIDNDRSASRALSRALAPRCYVVTTDCIERAHALIAQHPFEVMIAPTSGTTLEIAELVLVPRAFDVDRLFAEVARIANQTRTCARLHEAEAEIIALRCATQTSFDVLVATSPEMRSVVELAKRAAATSANILIAGEPGTGKRTLARAIHAASERACGPCIIANCNGSSERQLAIELFGGAAGSMPGMVGEHVGWFERARGGTLVLEDVDCVPLALQGVLDRALRDRRTYPVGDERERSTDVRTIATSACNGSTAVERGTLRSDLRYTLDVFAIALPPLRKRSADIAPLIAHFGNRIGKHPSIMPSALAMLRAYKWPGNLRELEVVIEGVHAISKGPITRAAVQPHLYL